MKSSLLFEVRAAAEAGTIPTLTRSGEYVINSRGQRLHLRTAQASSAKGLILYVHGIGAHCSRPNTKYFSSFFTTKLNYHYAAFDFHGHGYSEGERGFINTYDDLLDDLSSVLSALYRESDKPAGESHHQVNLAPLLPSDCPFFLFGNSMGGGVTLLFTHLLTHCPPPDAAHPRYSVACKGCILSAPALQISKPPAAILALLDWVVAPLFPTAAVPSVFSSLKSDTLVWDSDDYISYIQRDPLANNAPIVFRTAQSVMRLCEAVQGAMPLIAAADLRILVFMDPEDKICQFQGVCMLQEVSPIALRGDVKVVPMVDGRHDLLTNRMDEVAEVVEQWLRDVVV